MKKHQQCFSEKCSFRRTCSGSEASRRREYTMRRAKRKALWVSVLVIATFILCWGKTMPHDRLLTRCLHSSVIYFFPRFFSSALSHSDDLLCLCSSTIEWHRRHTRGAAYLLLRWVKTVQTMPMSILSGDITRNSDRNGKENAFLPIKTSCFWFF